MLAVWLLTDGEAAQLRDYIYAGVVLLYAAAITDWGLGTLLTREVARLAHAPEEDEAGRERRDLAARSLFGRMLGLRLGLSLAALLPISLLAFSEPARIMFNLTAGGSWALLLLGLSLLPNAFSASATALYNAHERMALPALIQVITALVNVGLGVLALLMGWGAAGLAGAALVTTAITALVFWRLMSRHFFAPRISFDARAARDLLIEAFPLMINSLLIIVFFRFDLIIIKAAREADVVTYENAYKFINVTQIIAPSVVLALFPRMARAALADRALLVRQFRGAVKVLLAIGLPLVATTVVLAEALIIFITLGRDVYLPGSAWALMILIWYLPLSFVNGVAQYVLIALHRQRWLTWAIAAAAIFNVGANLIAVPLIGIYGAAAVTILSEIVLLVPFLGWTARELGHRAVLPGRRGAGMALAGTALFAITFGLFAAGLNPVLAALVGAASFVALLLRLGVISREETDLVRRLLSRQRG